MYFTPIDTGTTLMSGARSRHRRPLDEDTLLYFLRSIIGQAVTLELQDEVEVNGVLEDIDSSFMCTLQNTTRRQMGLLSRNKVIHQDSESIPYSKVKYIHLPEDLDVFMSMQVYTRKLEESDRKYTRSKRKVRKEFDDTSSSDGSDNDNGDDVSHPRRTSRQTAAGPAGETGQAANRKRLAPTQPGRIYMSSRVDQHDNGG